MPPTASRAWIGDGAMKNDASQAADLTISEPKGTL
jgi:hypothetical protein